MSEIFISYSNADNWQLPHSLHSQFIIDETFHSDQIYYDKQKLDHGIKWEDNISQNLFSSTLFIPLFGDNWLENYISKSPSQIFFPAYELTQAINTSKFIYPIATAKFINEARDYINKSDDKLISQILKIQANHIEHDSIDINNTKRLAQAIISKYEEFKDRIDSINFDELQESFLNNNFSLFLGPHFGFKYNISDTFKQLAKSISRRHNAFPNNNELKNILAEVKDYSTFIRFMNKISSPPQISDDEIAESFRQINRMQQANTELVEYIKSMPVKIIIHASHLPELFEDDSFYNVSYNDILNDEIKRETAFQVYNKQLHRNKTLVIHLFGYEYDAKSTIDETDLNKLLSDIGRTFLNKEIWNSDLIDNTTAIFVGYNFNNWLVKFLLLLEQKKWGKPKRVHFLRTNNTHILDKVDEHIGKGKTQVNTFNCNSILEFFEIFSFLYKKANHG